MASLDPKDVQRIEQETGAARELAAKVSAFYLECLRSGVSQAESANLTGSYITADVNARMLKTHLDSKDGKPPWAQ